MSKKQDYTDPSKRLNPYDLNAIADICRKHSKIKPRIAVTGKQPYEPERFLSAYNLLTIDSLARGK